MILQDRREAGRGFAARLQLDDARHAATAAPAAVLR
jgi:hypothetical protein